MKSISEPLADGSPSATPAGFTSGIERKHLVVVLMECGERTIAGNAIRRSLELTRFFNVSIISNNFRSGIPAVIRTERVTLRDYSHLRRLGHIVHEVMFSLAARKRIAEMESKPDFILCHGHSPAYFVGRYFARRGVPYGLFMHGDIFDRPWGMYGVVLTCFYRIITPKAAAEAALVVGQSPAQAALASRHKPKGRVAVVPNGIDPRDIGLKTEFPVSPSEDYAGQRPFRLLFVGNFSAEKGVDILLEACGVLSRSGQPVEITMAGPAPESPELAQLVKEYGLQERVRLLGRVPRGGLAPVYRSADLLCVPSRSEAMANVVLEALSCGTPVAASDVGGNPTMVRHGVNGWLVAPNTPEAWAKTLQTIISDTAALASAKRAAPAVVTRFSWREVSTALAREIFLVLEQWPDDGKQAP